MAISINGTHQNSILPLCWLLNFIYRIAECCYAEYDYAEYDYAEYDYAEYDYAEYDYAEYDYAEYDYAEWRYAGPAFPAYIRLGYY